MMNCISSIFAVSYRVIKGICVFYRTQVSLGSDLWVRFSVTEPPFADLIDVTLADEDTNSILTDNANRQSKPMQCSNASDATWWPTLETMQVAPPDD